MGWARGRDNFDSNRIGIAMQQFWSGNVRELRNARLHLLETNNLKMDGRNGRFLHRPGEGERRPLRPYVLRPLIHAASDTRSIAKLGRTFLAGNHDLSYPGYPESFSWQSVRCCCLTVVSSGGGSRVAETRMIELLGPPVDTFTRPG